MGKLMNLIPFLFLKNFLSSSVQPETRPLLLTTSTLSSALTHKKFLCIKRSPHDDQVSDLFMTTAVLSDDEMGRNLTLRTLSISKVHWEDDLSLFFNGLDLD